MNKAQLSLMVHIPLFLEYCKDIGLSLKTQENYKRCLNKFILWLKENRKDNLLPKNLSISDINDYKSYLHQFRDKDGNSLRGITQNLYLIALRALLRYFAVKDVVSLNPAKIGLVKQDIEPKTSKLLNKEQIHALLSSPSNKTISGLRDRALLGIIIYGNLKIGQIISLNRDYLEKNNAIPQNTSLLIKIYLESRKDSNEALFVNLRINRNTGKRLTARSVQRIIQHYGKKIHLPFLITPEILRWVNINDLLNKKIEIKTLSEHEESLVKNYIPGLTTKENLERVTSPSCSWGSVEDAIVKEIKWLKNNISIINDGFCNGIFQKINV